MNTARGANWDLLLLWKDCRIHDRFHAAHELDVAALLADFYKTSRLQLPHDLAEGLWIKPRQPQPQLTGPEERVWRMASQNKAPEPL